MTNIKQIKIDNIKLSGFNPPTRTDEQSLLKLLHQIQSAGRIIQPVVIGNDGVLADGHRRVKCAKELGWKTVPAIIIDDMDAKTAWVVLNAGSMNLTPSQWLAAVFYGLPIETANIPPSIRSRIDVLNELLPPEMMARLVELKRSPGIVDTAKYIARYCDLDGDKEFLKKIIVWFIDNQSQFSARRAVADECPSDLLIDAINDNRSIKTVWEIE